MPKVEFEADKYYQANDFVTNSYSGLTGFFIKTGVAKDVGQANKVMLGIFVIFVSLSIFIITTSRNSIKSQNVEIPIDQRYLIQ